MVWKDLSDAAFKITPRVNASFTAVPPERVDLEDVPLGGAPTEGTLYLFGGDNGTTPLREMWVYNVATGEWDEPEFRGEAPTARSRHSCTLIRYFRAESQKEEDRLYIFGGVGQHTEIVLYLDIAHGKWVVPRTIGLLPPPLLGHTTGQTGAILWIVGGRDARRAYNTIWRLDTTTHEWTKPVATGVQPPACSKHSMIVQVRHRLLGCPAVVPILWHATPLSSSPPAADRPSRLLPKALTAPSLRACKGQAPDRRARRDRAGPRADV